MITKISNHQQAVSVLDLASISYKLRYQHEINLIKSKKLEFDHFSPKEKVLFFTANFIGEKGRSEAQEAYYWYRVMERKDYIGLKNMNRLSAVANGYCGIATNFTYVDKEYLTNHSQGTHLVEFIPSYPHLTAGKRWTLYNAFKEYANKKEMTFEEPKAEGNGGTFGLGPGNNNGLYGECFNELLDKCEITIRLVKCRLPLPE